MGIQRFNLTVRWLVLAVILLAAGGLIYVAVRYAVAEHWAASSNPDLWLRAANLEPANAGNWYRLGRYRQLDFENENLPLAISYYQRATAIEPITALYWLDLAGTYETRGSLAMAEQSYRAAQQAYPISGEVAWRFGNFLLRQDRVPEAFQQIQRAVTSDPKLATLAVSRCWRSTQDVDQILNSALPANADAYWGAIQFFVSAYEPNAAMTVWKRLAAKEHSFPLSQASPLLDLLIATNRGEDAQTVWEQALSAAGIARPEGGASLIWNGDFEQELLNAGMAWRYQPIQGAELDWDEEIVHSGRRSLRITFDGSANLDFQQIWQYVSVKPNTAYRFSVYFQTQQLTTDSGIHFEIHDVAPSNGIPPSTPNVVGTSPWALDEIQFTTGPRTHLIRVLLRRLRSNMLSNRVRGTVWVDDVSLVPASLPPLGAR